VHQHAYVFLRKSGRDEPRRHRTRSLRVVADGIGRVDLDQRFLDFEQRALFGFEVVCRSDAGRAERHQD
jgi:hypothetical protein